MGVKRKVSGIWWIKSRNAYFSRNPDSYVIDPMAGQFELWVRTAVTIQKLGKFLSVSKCMQAAEIHFIQNDHINQDVNHG